MTILVIILIIIIVLILGWIWYRYGTDSTNKATYTIKFITAWGQDPLINHPENPHTGNMFLVTHDQNFKLFEVGKLASNGVSVTSMYGTIDDLKQMVKDNDSIGNVVTAPVLMAPGRTNMSIDVTADKSNLSFVTMIAPSSDWFTGFSLKLIQNGKWINNGTIPLYVYIAGTDSNQGFVTEHIPRQVPEPISVKDDLFLYPTGKIVPIAHIMYSRTS
jgi:hypothetical protein